MLTLHDERVGESQVTMKNDALVRFEFKNEVDHPPFRVDVEHVKDEVLQIA
jgi:hypothetical protein